MAEPTPAQALAILKASINLSESEDRLWRMFEQRRFSEIPATNDQMSGEDFIEKIEAYFANTKSGKVPENAADLPLLKGPEADAFFAAHTEGMPDAEAQAFKQDFLEYAQKHINIRHQAEALDKATGSSKLSTAIIGRIDKHYEDGAAHDKGMNATRIAMEEMQKSAPAMLKKAIAAHIKPLADRDRSGTVSTQDEQNLAHKIMDSIHLLESQKRSGAPLSETAKKQAMEARTILKSVDLDGDGKIDSGEAKLMQSTFSAVGQNAFKRVVQKLTGHTFSVADSPAEQSGQLPRQTAGKEPASQKTTSI